MHRPASCGFASCLAIWEERRPVPCRVPSKVPWSIKVKGIPVTFIGGYTVVGLLLGGIPVTFISPRNCRVRSQRWLKRCVLPMPPKSPPVFGSSALSGERHAINPACAGRARHSLRAAACAHRLMWRRGQRQMSGARKRRKERRVGGRRRRMVSEGRPRIQLYGAIRYG